MASTALSRPLLSLRAGVLLAVATAAVAQTEFPFAAGTDAAGRAKAVSGAAGRVMIESPEFPRGLWVDLVDEAGQALAGVQVEYQGRADSLVTLRCVDPSGLRQETLLWTRAFGDPLRLALKTRDPAGLPPGLASIDWRIDPGVEALLESSRLVGWEAVEAFLRERWQGQVGLVFVRLDDGGTAVDLDHEEAIEMVVRHLQKTHQPVTPSTASSPFFAVLVNESDLLRNEVILQTTLFASEGLEAAVRQALRRPQGRITRQEVASMTRFQLSDDIHSLAGLEHLVALEHLYLAYNDVEDLSPLAALTNLRELYLSYNHVSDVRPLAGLTKLTRMELRKNRISDVSPLSDLINLVDLDLRENQISDVSPLGSLTNLRFLWLDGNQIDVLVALTPLENLTSLRLEANRITDVSPLSDLINLTALNLVGNQISDVGPLGSLTNLRWLELADNSIVDVSPLAALTNLKRLQLVDNEIADVSPLAALTNLEWLNLWGNWIVDVSPLAVLTKLGYLHLTRNQIQDIGPLVANMGLSAPDEINLQSNPLSDQAINEHIPALRARGVRVIY